MIDSNQTATLAQAPQQYKVHFPGLNALRFYAAFAVIYSHIAQNTSPLPKVYKAFDFILIDAHSAVSLFFTLSGFLITYLLLQEQKVADNINVGKFYLRRIFRIWPLYYLIAIVGFGIYPLIFGQNYFIATLYPEYPDTPMSIGTKLFFVFFLMPNFSGVTAPMGHLWSIGVEEQFYAFWPWVVRNKSGILKVAFGILIIKFILTPFLPAFGVSGMIKIFDEARFECMAIGAIGAYLYFNGHTLMKYVYHPVTQIAAMVGIAIMALMDVSVNPYNSTAIAIIFITIILNLATNPKSLVHLENKIVNRLGQISYGLYLYHFPIVYLFLVTVSKIDSMRGTFLSASIMFAGITFTTWLVSEISYRWFETPFLNLKDRFATVHTSS